MQDIHRRPSPHPSGTRVVAAGNHMNNRQLIMACFIGIHIGVDILIAMVLFFSFCFLRKPACPTGNCTDLCNNVLNLKAEIRSSLYSTDSDTWKNISYDPFNKWFYRSHGSLSRYGDQMAAMGPSDSAAACPNFPPLAAIGAVTEYYDPEHENRQIYIESAACTGAIISRSIVLSLRPRLSSVNLFEEIAKSPIVTPLGFIANGYVYIVDQIVVGKDKLTVAFHYELLGDEQLALPCYRFAKMSYYTSGVLSGWSSPGDGKVKTVKFNFEPGGHPANIEMAPVFASDFNLVAFYGRTNASTKHKQVPDWVFLNEEKYEQWHEKLGL